MPEGLGDTTAERPSRRFMPNVPFRLRTQDPIKNPINELILHKIPPIPWHILLKLQKRHPNKTLQMPTMRLTLLMRIMLHKMVT